MKPKMTTQPSRAAVLHAPGLFRAAAPPPGAAHKRSRHRYDADNPAAWARRTLAQPDALEGMRTLASLVLSGKPWQEEEGMETPSLKEMARYARRADREERMRAVDDPCDGLDRAAVRAAHQAMVEEQRTKYLGAGVVPSDAAPSPELARLRRIAQEMAAASAGLDD